MFPKWILYTFSFPDYLTWMECPWYGMSMIWTFNFPSFMGIYKNKSTWNDLLDMFKVTSTLFSTLKNLCGFKKSPWSWYGEMRHKFIHDTNFSICHYDPNFYTKNVGVHIIIYVIYVDDFILTGSDLKCLTHMKWSLKKKFEWYT